MNIKVDGNNISILDKAIKNEKSRDKFIENFKPLFGSTKREKEEIEGTLGNIYDAFHPKKAEKPKE